ncbi:hypothetical protein [Variovorax sp. W2I14]|uniref:hypothetical protein n=1 Tax=Variovorax sp. W2I14 TaxID=3042290 RepID=UPI003D202750
MTSLLRDTDPALWAEALRYPFGLTVVELPRDTRPLLLLKLTQQLLLTARMNRGFKIYVVPLDTPAGPTVGLMSAFFEDHDEPLTIWSPLSPGNDTTSLLKALRGSALTVRLFDEHNREFLAYAARLEVPLMPRVRLDHAKLLNLTQDLAHYMHEQGKLWFSNRESPDDDDAISVVFESALYEENLAYVDDRTELFKYQGSKGSVEIRLEKDTPEDLQEIDIILLLQRLFKPEHIYHSPKKPTNNKEIADILIITDRICLIVQAKDSPNTEEQLGNEMERKQASAKKHLAKACGQLARSVAYLRQHRPLVMKMGDREETIDLGQRTIMSLAVVRELFDNGRHEYSQALYELHKKSRLPCIGIDYSELIQYMTFCDSEESFIRAYFQVFNKALEGDGFLPLRFGLDDLFDQDGKFRFT